MEVADLGAVVRWDCREEGALLRGWGGVLRACGSGVGTRGRCACGDVGSLVGAERRAAEAEGVFGEEEG